MRKKGVLALIVAIAGFIIMTALPGDVMADGDDILGPPSILVASGTGIIAAGTGLQIQPGTIDINIPPGATINQVLLYWSGGVLSSNLSDDTIVLQKAGPAFPITGTLIGTSVELPSGNFNTVYRADITDLGLVVPGLNSIEASGLNMDFNDGAGIAVIIDDGSGDSLELLDGGDYAFAPDPAPRTTTIPQTFMFDPSNEDRIARLSMFFGTVQGAASGGGFRPSAIEVTVDGTLMVFDNMLSSNDGEEWDTLILDIPIPAGATSLTVQPLSKDNDPPDTGPNGETEGAVASLIWNMLSFSIPPAPFCGDGNVDEDLGETCDPPGSFPPDGAGNACRNGGTDYQCTYCGDGIKQEGAGEECDFNDQNDPLVQQGLCDDTCNILPYCGDGIVGNTPGESCDPPGSIPPSPPGNQNVCRNDGSPEECTYCGDGELQPNVEQCDDGNAINNDGCSNNCMIEEPGIDIEKVTDSVDNQNTTPPDFDNEDDANGSGVPVIPAGSNITWTYKVTNTGDQAFAQADVVVQDSVEEVNSTLVLADDGNGDDILSPGEMWFYEATGVALDLLNPPDPLPDGVNIVEGCSNSFGDPQPPTATYMNTATVTADGLEDSDDSHYCGPPPACEIIVTKTCIVPPPGDGDQGCTPGYWKQSQHFGSWVGFDQNDDYETVFGVDASFTTTLLGAMEQGGGGELALGRHAVAALLNASNPDVEYFTDVAGVIALVQDAYDTGAFETIKNVLDFENNRGCPLNSNSSSDSDAVDDSATVQQAGAEECTVTAGTEVKYNYEIENTGSVNIAVVEVIDDPDPGNPFEVPGSPVQDLAPGEIETLMSTAVIDETTTNTVTVTGNPGPEQCIAMDTATVVVRERPPITRTIGYWKNHPTVIDGSFDGPGGFPSLLPLDFCGEDIVESCDAVSFLSTGGGGIDCFKRQAMAALLNCQAFGCPDEIFNLIMSGSNACGNGTAFDFDAACSVLDAYNNFGDDLDLPFQSPSAQPKFCKDN